MSKTSFSIIIIFILFLLLLSKLSFAVVDASKSYQVGIKVYNEGKYEKSIRLLENAIEAGLSGLSLKDAYLKIYTSALFLEDDKTIQLYEKKCRANVSGFKKINPGAFTDLVETSFYIEMMINKGEIDPRTKMDIFANLAKSGKIYRALSMANSFNDEKRKQWALIQLAIEIAKVENVDKALDIIAYSEKFDNNYQYLSEMAVRLASAGETKKVLDALRLIKESKEETTQRIALEFAKNGYIKEALKFSESIQTQLFKDNVMIEIAISYIKAKEVEQGIDILLKLLNSVKSMKNGREKDYFFERISFGFSKADKPEKALEVAELSQEKWSKNEAKKAIAGHLAIKGKTNESSSIYRSLVEEGEVFGAFYTIVYMLAEAGKINESLDFIESFMSDPKIDMKASAKESTKIWALHYVVDILSNNGKSERALNIVSPIKKKEDKLFLLRIISINSISTNGILENELPKKIMQMVLN